MRLHYVVRLALCSAFGIMQCVWHYVVRLALCSVFCNMWRFVICGVMHYVVRFALCGVIYNMR